VSVTIAGVTTLEAAPIIGSMEFEVRPFEGSLKAWFDSVDVSFGQRVVEADLPVMEAYTELDRALAAYAGDRVVGTAGIFTFDLTIPGGLVPAAGVTMVGVHPTHRRRGILTAMMRAQLQAIHDRGESLAILWASEAGIYGRFGYGLASFKASIEIERARAGFRDQHVPTGSFRLLDPDEATDACRPIYDSYLPTRAGAFSRNDGWWRAEFIHDPERWRRGGGPAFFLLHETDGVADAYARYRLHGDWDERGPKGAIDVSEAIALNPTAERELWAYLFSVDLSAKTRAFNVPVDWGMRFMLSEPRRLGMTIGDAVWLRIVDLPAALERRGYAGRDRLTLEIRDAFCPWNDGRWQLDASPDSTTVTRTEADPDLRLEAADLGSTYLGGVSLAELVLADRVEECTPGAVARGDALLRTPLAPWCPAVF
jgi:predicted acetyltransferase